MSKVHIAHDVMYDPKTASLLIDGELFPYGTKGGIKITNAPDGLTLLTITLPVTGEVVIKSPHDKPILPRARKNDD